MQWKSTINYFLLWLRIILNPHAHLHIHLHTHLHLSLWNGQVHIADDIQFAVGLADITTPDGHPLYRRRRRGLRVHRHIPLVQLKRKSSTADEYTHTHTHTHTLVGLCNFSSTTVAGLKKYGKNISKQTETAIQTITLHLMWCSTHFLVEQTVT